MEFRRTNSTLNYMLCGVEITPPEFHCEPLWDSKGERVASHGFPSFLATLTFVLSVYAGASVRKLVVGVLVLFYSSGLA